MKALGVAGPDGRYTTQNPVQAELFSIWLDHTDHYGIVAGSSGVAVGADSNIGGGGGGICRAGLVYLTPGIIFP